jgi:hypothetical protein
VRHIVLQYRHALGQVGQPQEQDVLSSVGIMVVGSLEAGLDESRSRTIIFDLSRLSGRT